MTNGWPPPPPPPPESIARERAKVRQRIAESIFPHVVKVLPQLSPSIVATRTTALAEALMSDLEASFRRELGEEQAAAARRLEANKRAN